MAVHRPLVGIFSLILTLVLGVALVPPAAGTPSGPDGPAASKGRGSVPQVAAPRLDRRGGSSGLHGPAAREADEDIAMPTSYPFQPELRTYPDASPDDAADSGDLVAYDEIAPLLNKWMADSNRISSQVVGQSTAGRDLYLVTVTSPESRRETSQQTRWRNLIRNDPGAAAEDDRLAASYKTPIWFSANIHGNEWEGTDASLQYIEDLVTAPPGEVDELLDNHRLYFSLTLNPDGRTIGQRATTLDLDVNRDMITQATPESLSFIKTAQAVQPLYAADLHGYTGVLQVEPCGPPHGENYEYDLFIGHAYAAALRVERDVVAADIPGNTYYDIRTGQVVPENTSEDTAHIKIPYRDTPSGWDDFPPIFTAQYAAFYGAVTSTVELPKSRPNSSSQTPENARVNTAVAKQTITSIVDYVAENSADMLANQIEVFRRGTAGEPKDSLTTDDVAAVPGPDEWKPLWDSVDDQDPVALPRAYVIPVGDGQRSMSDASDLVRQLLRHDIEVGRLTRTQSVDGTTYPAGSYVVGMHQPLRGLANSLLDLGSDISDKVPTMYDISAWSYSYLWGATVDKVGATTDPPLADTRPVTAPTRVGSVEAGARHLTFDLAGVRDYRALNALLEEDVDVVLLQDGTPVFGRSELAALREVSRRYDVAVERATAGEVSRLDDPRTKPLDDLTIAYSGTQDDKLSLTELGFDDLVPVSASVIDETPSVLDEADVLWVGGRLDFTAAQAAGRQAVQAFVDSGRPLVGRGEAAALAATTFGLLDVTAVSGDRRSNGIVAVDTPDDGVLTPYAQPAAFVYPAVSFVDLGPGTSVEQRYDESAPLLAGHWRGRGTGTEEFAAGKPSAVSGEAASGARGFVFGTSVFFRTHPKGGMSQAARAILWSVPDEDDTR